MNARNGERPAETGPSQNNIAQRTVADDHHALTNALQRLYARQIFSPAFEQLSPGAQSLIELLTGLYGNPETGDITDRPEEEMSKAIGVPRRTLRRRLDEIVASGLWIRKRKRVKGPRGGGRKAPSRYFVNPSAIGHGARPMEWPLVRPLGWPMEWPLEWPLGPPSLTDIASLYRRGDEYQSVSQSALSVEDRIEEDQSVSQNAFAEGDVALEPEQAEQQEHESLKLVEEILGQQLRHPGRAEVSRALVENEAGVVACAELAKRKSTSDPVGLLLTMIRNGQHRPRHVQPRVPPIPLRLEGPAPIAAAPVQRITDAFYVIDVDSVNIDHDRAIVTSSYYGVFTLGLEIDCNDVRALRGRRVRLKVRGGLVRAFSEVAAEKVESVPGQATLPAGEHRLVIDEIELLPDGSRRVRDTDGRVHLFSSDIRDYDYGEGAAVDVYVRKDGRIYDTAPARADPAEQRL